MSAEQGIMNLIILAMWICLDYFIIKMYLDTRKDTKRMETRRSLGFAIKKANDIVVYYDDVYCKFDAYTQHELVKHVCNARSNLENGKFENTQNALDNFHKLYMRNKGEAL